MLTKLDAGSRLRLRPARPGGKRLSAGRAAASPRSTGCGSASSTTASGTPTSCCATRRGAGAAARFAAVNYYVKQSFSKEAGPALIARIAAENDIVLTAIGDCGSCCSCCVRDAIALERWACRPPASSPPSSCSEAELTRAALGMPGLRPGGDRPSRQLDHRRGGAPPASRRSRGRRRRSGWGR